MSPNEYTITKASFNPKVQTYWLLSTTIILTMTIVGIPLLILWLPLGLYFTGKYLSHLSCELTNKSLKVSRGFLIRVEKTVPLDKITDMSMVQGPIMRSMDLYSLSVETAGQSGPGALVQLTGIIDAPAFRDMVLKQRDEISATKEVPETEEQVFKEIRDTLKRIEAHLIKD